MKQLTGHWDSHGLNESILVEATDEPGPGGAHHRYAFHVPGDSTGKMPQTMVGSLQFQCGPRNEPDSIPGVTEGAVLAVLIDRLEAFQAGPYACAENEAALAHLRTALVWFKVRADRRAARGVLGTTEP